MSKETAMPSRWTRNLLGLAFAGLWAGALVAPTSARAESSRRSHTSTLAVGLGLGWVNRDEYGASSFTRLQPEFVAHGYLDLFDTGLFLRPGLRLGYAWEQPEMPGSVAVEERDLTLSGELGVLFDWIIVPTVTAGGGFDRRNVVLKTSAPVAVVDDRISRTETLPYFYVQASVGIPIWQGRFVLEPYVRYLTIEGDRRINTAYGVEFTVEVL